jgi:deoxyribose-phosphate aldolase
MKREELARMIDHTLLRVEASRNDIERICREAIQYSFYSVCTNPYWVRLVRSLVKGTEVKVCSVSGFPLGASTAEVKVEEARRCAHEGADEIDMVMNVGAFKDGDHSLVRDEIERVVEAAGKGRIIKVIIEACVLTDEEKIRSSKLAAEAGAGFVKTSTGFASGGATASDVRLMRKAVGPKVGVKASGGVRTFEQAVLLVEAGASRIGTSASVDLVT